MRRFFRKAPCVDHSRFISYRKWVGAENNPLSPIFSKAYLAMGFLMSMLYVTVFAANKVLEPTKKELSKEEKRELEKQADPRRPPWPLLHQRIVFMREGKSGHEDLGLLWEQTRFYYPWDWLIPLEIAQVLKYTSAHFLQAYVEDPEQLRKEVLFQLLNVKYGKVPNAAQHKINREVEEIISIAVEELENISLVANSEALLVPTHTK